MLEPMSLLDYIRRAIFANQKKKTKNPKDENGLIIKKAKEILIQSLLILRNSLQGLSSIVYPIGYVYHLNVRAQVHKSFKLSNHSPNLIARCQIASRVLFNQRNSNRISFEIPCEESCNRHLDGV